MRQMNGINQMEQSQYNKVGRGADVSAYNNIMADVSKGQGSIDVPSFSYEKSKAEQVKTGSLIDNFDEFRKQKLEQEKEKNIDEEEVLEEQREHAKELAAALSEDEIAMLQSMGIDVESVKLSDLQGIVSTMRQQSHKEEMSRIIQSLQMETMPQEDKKFSLSNDELVYLLRNELPTTKDNLLKAHFSGSKMQEANVPDLVFEPMKQQIASIIEQTGYVVDDEKLAGAKVLLSNNLPITSDTMKQYLDYQALLGQSIEDVDLPEKTEALVEEKAEALMNAVSDISDETVVLMTEQGKELTIAAASSFEKVMPEKSFEGAWQISGAESYEAIKQMRMLQEIRLTMTVEAANRLVSKDFNIDTKPLAKVVDELREMEQQMLAYTMREEGIANPQEAASTYFEAKNMVANIAAAPASVLAAPLRQGTFTIASLGAEANAVMGQDTAEASTTGFETVRRSYEAVGTAPRYDLGDRISKAFSNIEDMLGEMNVEVNEENVRAVRILGYNSMEITESNIEQIVAYDREVNELISNFSPATVLAVIKEGKNPMDEPIESLNRKLRERNDKGAVSDTDNFASFLRDMEKQGVVDADERESYIGLYRLMNQLAKSGDREAGYLFASGANLTIRNLISAMRSAKASGLNVSVDDSFGMLEERNLNGARIDDQIEKAFLAQEADAVRARVQDATEETMRYMQENGIEQSLVNASAVNTMLNTSGGIYSMAYSLLSKLSGYKDASDYAVDEETENMTDSLMGEDVPLQFAPEGVLEQLAKGPLMADYYESLSESLTNMMYEAGAASTIVTEDLSMMKTVQAGFRIMGGLARENKFQIPLQTEEGVQVVNLAFEQGQAHGQIEISMRTAKYGDVKGQFVLAAGGLAGQIVADSSEANFGLQASVQAFSDALQKEGVAVDNITLGQAIDTMPESMQNATADVYNVMLACVKAMRSFI